MNVGGDAQRKQRGIAPRRDASPITQDERGNEQKNRYGAPPYGGFDHRHGALMTSSLLPTMVQSVMSERSLVTEYGAAIYPILPAPMPATPSRKICRANAAAETASPSASIVHGGGMPRIRVKYMLKISARV